jgi:hypothetical protein
MPHAYEATIDEDGNVRIGEPVRLSTARRALVVVLDEDPIQGSSETAFLSEKSLAGDWNRPEEDEAWSYLEKETK